MVQNEMADKPFIQFLKSEESLELISKPNELALLSLVAIRAKRTNGLSVNGLGPGEAMIGDFEACGLTRQRYRTALKNLKKWGILTTRTTNKGTIAKIINTDIYDINISEANQQANHQPTIEQPSANHQATTNNKDKNEKKDKKYISPPLGEFQNVKLQEQELAKLNEAFGEDGAKELIERLSGYIASKGKKYKSHYATILNWARKDGKLGKAKPPKRNLFLDALEKRRGDQRDD
jgi:hypothetical protein